METVKDSSIEPLSLARRAAAILIVLLAVMPYTVSPNAGSAIDGPVAAYEGAMEQQYLPSDCAVDGLVFADCYLEL